MEQSIYLLNTTIIRVFILILETDPYPLDNFSIGGRGSVGGQLFRCDERTSDKKRLRTTGLYCNGQYLITSA